ncbi:hypothetical protein GCWU000325_00800 [Alloprevotella tannerae ATCC 51259]|uniref:Uncharacterized protein n=1 Tax=Alloprevotella tannerae ATCC 51259 TaxID=626522 RepID=C9LF20_9BACT|nr:hypothetical protein GCWU000325_00800 [Alloprevotella tannerae ATCC 51259]
MFNLRGRFYGTHNRTFIYCCKVTNSFQCLQDWKELESFSPSFRLTITPSLFQKRPTSEKNFKCASPCRQATNGPIITIKRSTKGGLAISKRRTGGKFQSTGRSFGGSKRWFGRSKQ